MVERFFLTPINHSGTDDGCGPRPPRHEKSLHPSYKTPPIYRLPNFQHYKTLSSREAVTRDLLLGCSIWNEKRILYCAQNDGVWLRNLLTRDHAIQHFRCDDAGFLEHDFPVWVVDDGGGQAFHFAEYFFAFVIAQYQRIGQADFFRE